MLQTFVRASIGIAFAGWLAGCGASAEECFDLGALDCADDLGSEPFGSAKCQASYLLGYAASCTTTTSTSDSDPVTSGSSSSSGSDSGY
ncbi:MAG: hypothetical protein ABMB14_12640 [Myxococcota bacterium]